MINARKLLEQLPDRVEIGKAILKIDAELRRLRTLYRLRVKIDNDSREPPESVEQSGASK